MITHPDDGNDDSHADRFGITRGALAERLFIPLSEDEFNQIANSKQVLLNLLDAEEAFDLLVENYLELEKECLSIAVDETVRPSRRYADLTIIGACSHVA